MVRKILLSALLLTSVAQAECIMQEVTTSITDATITQHDNIQKTITPFGDQYKCTVQYKALVNNEWHLAAGEYVFGDMSPYKACGIAIQHGDRNLLNRIASSNTQSQQTLICNDSDTMKPIDVPVIGKVGKLSQFRTSPDHPDVFFYRQSECRWITMSGMDGKKFLTNYGIICKIDNESWIVVDKF